MPPKKQLPKIHPETYYPKEPSRGSDYEECYASPIRPTPKDPDHREFRYKGALEGKELADDRGFIVERFRVGGPYLCSIPAETFVLQSTPACQKSAHLKAVLEDKRDEWLSYLHKLLESEEIEIGIDSIRFCGRRSRTNPETYPVLTLLIMPKDCSMYHRWLRVCHIIYSRLRLESEIEHISVEIAVEEGIRPMNIIGSLGVWERLLPIMQRLLEHIKGQIPQQYIENMGFSLVEVPERHLPDEETVWIVIPPDGQGEDWRAIRDKVVEIFNTLEISNVGVRIIKDASTFGQPPAALPPSCMGLFPSITSL